MKTGLTNRFTLFAHVEKPGSHFMLREQVRNGRARKIMRPFITGLQQWFIFCLR